MNKTVLGTIAGIALLPFFKGKGSKIKMGSGKFYTIVMDNILIKEHEHSHLSERAVSQRIEDRIRQIVLGGEKDKEFINILKPIIFDKERNFRYSFSVSTNNFWRNRCKEIEWHEEMEVCEYEIRIILASVRDISNLPENEDEIIMNKIESIIKDSISSYVDIHGYDFELSMDEAEFAIYKGVQDVNDPRNWNKSIVKETKDGTWEPFKNSLKKSKLRKR